MRHTPRELESATALVNLSDPAPPPFRPWEDATTHTTTLSHVRSTLPLILQVKDHTTPALKHPSSGRLGMAQLSAAAMAMAAGMERTRGPTLAPIINSVRATRPSLPPLSSLSGLNDLGDTSPLSKGKTAIGAPLHALPNPAHAAVAGRSAQRSTYRPTAGPLRPLRPIALKRLPGHIPPPINRTPPQPQQARASLPSPLSPLRQTRAGPSSLGKSSRGPKWATSSSPSLKTSPLRPQAQTVAGEVSSPLRTGVGGLRELGDLQAVPQGSDGGVVVAGEGAVEVEVDELDDDIPPVVEQGDNQPEVGVETATMDQAETPAREAQAASSAEGRKRKAKRDSMVAQERRTLPARKVRKNQHGPTSDNHDDGAGEPDHSRVVANPKPRAVADNARKGTNIERKLANFRAGKVFCYRPTHPAYNPERNMDADLRDKVFEWGTAADGPLLEQALWPHLSERQKRVVMTRDTPEGRDLLKALRLVWLIEFTDCVELKADVKTHCHRSIDNGMPCAVRVGMKSKMCAGCHLSKMTCDNFVGRDPQTIRRPAITDLRLYYHRLFNLTGLVEEQARIDYDAELPPVPAGNPIDAIVRRTPGNKGAKATASPPAESSAGAPATGPSQQATRGKKRVATDIELDSTAQPAPASTPRTPGARAAKLKRSLGGTAKEKAKVIGAVLKRAIVSGKAVAIEAPSAKRQRLGPSPSGDTGTTGNEAPREAAGPSVQLGLSLGHVGLAPTEPVAPAPSAATIRQRQDPDIAHAIRILAEGNEADPAYLQVWQIVQGHIRSFAKEIALSLPPAQSGESAGDLLRRVQDVSGKQHLAYLVGDHSNARININLAVSWIASASPYPTWIVGPLMRRLVSLPITVSTEQMVGVHWSSYHTQVANGGVAGILGYVPADTTKASHWAAFIMPCSGPQADRVMVYATRAGRDVFSHGIFTQWLHQIAFPSTSRRHKGRLASQAVFIECRVEDEAGAALCAFEQLAVHGPGYQPRIPGPDDFASRVRLPQARVLAYDQVIAMGMAEALRSKEGLAEALVKKVLPHCEELVMENGL